MARFTRNDVYECPRCKKPEGERGACPFDEERGVERVCNCCPHCRQECKDHTREGGYHR